MSGCAHSVIGRDSVDVIVSLLIIDLHYNILVYYLFKDFIPPAVN